MSSDQECLADILGTTFFSSLCVPVCLSVRMYFSHSCAGNERKHREGQASLFTYFVVIPLFIDD